MNRTHPPEQAGWLDGVASFVVHLIVLPSLYVAVAYAVILPGYALNAVIRGEPVALDPMFGFLGLILALFLLGDATYWFGIVGIRGLAADAPLSIAQTWVPIASRLGEFFLAYQVAALAVLLVLSPLWAAAVISTTMVAITIVLSPIGLLIFQQTWLWRENPPAPWQRYLPKLPSVRRVPETPPEGTVSAGRDAVHRALILFGGAMMIFTVCGLIESRGPAAVFSSVSLIVLNALAGISSFFLTLGALLYLVSPDVALFLRAKRLNFVIGGLLIAMGVALPLRAWTFDPTADDPMECPEGSSPGRTAGERDQSNEECQSALSKRETRDPAGAYIATFLGIALLIGGVRLMLPLRRAAQTGGPKIEGP